MSSSSSLPTRYFDDVYAASTDPWSFETSPYEAAKYADTLSALGERRFENAFEIGCSIGVLTARLATRCARLLAVDASDAPLARARARCEGLQGVGFARMQVPDAFPEQRFDLVVMSEVAYYWAPADLERASIRVVESLLPGGLWLMVHWTPVVADYPQTGDAVHDAVLVRSARAGELRHVTGWRRASYRLDLFEKLSSVAAWPAASPVSLPAASR